MKRSYTRILLTIFVMLMCIGVTRAQVSVTATGGTTSASYTTLGAAFSAINAGTHTGAIVIGISASTTETGACVLNSTGAGSASYTSVLIRPTADGVSVSGSTVTGRGLIELNGADNVTINGDNPNTAGTNRNLSLINTAANSVAATSVIRIALSSLVTSADNDTVKNCIITGSSNAYNSSSNTGTDGTAGIIASSGASTSSASTAPGALSGSTSTIASGQTLLNFTVDNNQVNSCCTGIAINGAATSVCPVLTITNNTIGNATVGSANGVYWKGISAQGFSTGSAIRSNTIYTESYISSSPYCTAITLGDVSSAGTGMTIEKNLIARVYQNNTGGWGAYGINLAAGDAIVVRNNFIYNVINVGSGSFSTTYGAQGIRIASGNNHQIYHNSVNLYGNDPGSSNIIACISFTGTSATGVDVRNNIFSNTCTSPSTNSAFSAVMFTSAPTAGMVTMNNNAYYTGKTSGLSALGQVGTNYGSGVYTFANFVPGATTPATNWRSVTSVALSTNDNASLADTAAAPFASATDLHIPAGTSTRLESGGASVGVTTDIDGQVRPGPAGSVNGGATSPDIGADEFDGIPVTPVITNVSTPTASCASAIAHTITATVSTPSGTITSVVLDYNNGSAGSVTMTLSSGTNTNGVWTGTIPAGTAGATTTWSITATNSASLTKTVTGTSYTDAPLAGVTAVASASPSSICPGSSSTLSVNPGSTTPVNNYDVASIAYNLTPTPSTGVTTLATGGTATTSLSSGTLDDGYWTITLPFSFNLYGTAYTSAAIGTNGDVQFGTPTTTGYGNTWPTTSAPTGAFAALFGDMYDNVGTVNYFTTGTSPNRVLVINWTGVNWYSATPSASFQAKLYETSNVMEVHITSCTAGNSHLTGVQNTAGTVATVPAGRNLGTWAISTPEAWQFSPQLIPNATYLWTPNGAGSGIATGTQTQRTVTATPSATTTYTVTVSTSTGCSLTANTTVTLVTLPAAPTATNSTQCGVGVPTASVSGGSGTYKWYSASTGGTLLQRGGSTYTSSISTTTTFYVADSNGLCESNRTPVTVTVNTPDPVTAKANSTATSATSCLGVAVALSATKTGTTNNYTYTWTASPVTGSGIPAGGTTGQNISVTPTAAGTYVYTVTAVDASCTATSTVTVTVQNPFAGMSLTASATPAAICVGNPDTLRVTLGATNGAVFSEQFEAASFPLTSFVTASVSGTPTAIQNTTYYAQGTSSLLFNTTSTGADVSLSSATSVSLQGYTSAQLTFSQIAAMEGYISSYDYGYVQYSTDGGTTWTSFPTSSYAGTGTLFNSVVSFSTLSYSSWTSALTGASATPTNALWQNETINIPAAALTSSQFKIRFRYTTDGSINYYGWLIDNVKITAVAPTPSAYSWSNGTTVVGTTNPLVVSPTTTTTYTPTVTLAGCSLAATGVAVTVNPLPTATVTPAGTASFCAGSTAGVTLTANAGTGLTYQWYTGTTAISNATQQTYTALAAGSYTVKVTNSTGCSATSAATVVSVTPLPAATLTANGPLTFCTGGSVVLKSSTGTGYTYVWKRGTTTITGATDSSYTATITGSYTVTVTSGGCSATSIADSVNVVAAPSGTVTASGPLTFCQGVGVNLTAATAPTGQTYTYQWYNGTTALGTTQTWLATTSGSYTVVVSNGSCSTTSTPRVVTVLAAPTATITPAGPTSFCQGDSVRLNANTGTGLTYRWFRGATQVSTASSYVATIAGTYTVRVTNTNGCSTTSSAVIVTVNALPAAVITPVTSTVICQGDLATLSAGTGTGLTYRWYNNGTAITGATNNTYTTGIAGSYTVKVTNANGCSATSTAVLIEVVALPGATITYNTALNFCDGNSVTLSANTGTGYTYQWNNNSTPINGATNSTYTATTAGAYTVDVRNSNGCLSTSLPVTVTVYQLSTPIISRNGNVLSTTGYVTYQWYLNGAAIPGATNASYTVTQNGIYTVEGTDANGCVNISAMAQWPNVGVGTVSGKELKIFPNPTTSVIYIDAPVTVDASVCSLDGKELIYQKDAKQVDLANLADGVYMIKLLDQHKTVLKIEKLIKATR